MAMIYQKNKKTGITYAYENKAYWSKEKQQSRAKRVLIGKVDAQTGDIVPTRAYIKRGSTDEEKPLKPGPIATTQYARRFYGATYLLDAIGDKLDLTADLKQCFPSMYKQILSLAYYLIHRNDLTKEMFWKKNVGSISICITTSTGQRKTRKTLTVN
jgi:hypothetical protein